MPCTLTTLPIENLHQICKYLFSHSDVSNFRLVCRVFSGVGLHSLAPRVCFVLLPESLARLSDISSHPVLRHHVYTVVCLTDVLPLYNTFEEWKLDARRPGPRLGWPVQPNDTWALEADIASNARHQIPGTELDEGWTTYQSVLADQERAFKSLEHSQEVKNAFRRFTNLKHLEIARCETDCQVVAVQTFKRLYDKCLIQPFSFAFYPSEGFNYMGLPGVKPLASLLGAAMSEQNEIATLRVDRLDCQFFDIKETRFGSLSKGINKLRIIQLSMCVRDEDEDSTPWQDAKQTLSTNRLKNFLRSAPSLEAIELQFDNQLFEPYIANVANILPTELVWPGLRRLKLSGIEIHPASFLDFLSSHSQTLRSIDLSSCDLVAARPGSHSNAQSQSQGQSQYRWSDIFIHLSTILSLTTLSLSGSFFVSRIPSPALPRIRMSNSVQNVGLSISEALEMLVCSKQFDAFLTCKVESFESLDADAIKKIIIEDLVGNLPRRSEPPMDVNIPTRYESYIKEFKLLAGR